MRILVGISASEDWGNIVLLGDQGEVLLDHPLPHNLPVILEKLAPYRQDIGAIAVAALGELYWLTDGLLDAGYAVYASTPTAFTVPPQAGFAEGRWDAGWLAQHVAAGEYSGDNFYPAQYDSRLALYLAEHIKAFRRVVLRSFGAVLARQFDSTINYLADEQGLNFQINDGRIQMLAHSLAVQDCELLVKEAKIFAVKVIGTYKLINLIEETDHQYLLMNEQRDSATDGAHLLEDGLRQLDLASGI